MDYKLTLETDELVASGFRDLANTILGDYGEDYDAARGDFTVGLLESSESSDVIGVEVVMKDVALGDARSLADRLWERYDDETFRIRASRFDRGHWWPVDLNDEDEG